MEVKWVYGNTVALYNTAIKGAALVYDNKLTNNVTGVSGARQADGNSITSPATWLDPSYEYNPYSGLPLHYLTSVGIEVGCKDPKTVARSDTFNGLGVGIEDAKYGTSARPLRQV